MEKKLFDQLERAEQQRNAEAVVIGRNLLKGQRVGKVFLARHFGRSDEHCNVLRARWRQLMENQEQEQAQ
ncbi:hypothetical protein [Chromobacterium sp. IIBBL 290-4]|uniref:hypothetical protein n=1 Tax=Chromobacterium sp. IIBBL 290-4 TaxID=2953890 RepID=UPI0020B760C4|nr:hypothetical protein [Chromobacterium sp. IIBBL 290-4]UTH73317.1 hypothetical protein NKT35_17520 [Chromobacterium sp. IIBBL 290-4]